MVNTYYVYILTDKYGKELFTGLTSNLKKIVYNHKNRFIKHLFEKPNCDKLVYFNKSNNIADAIFKEKNIESKSNRKKIELVESVNPTWLELNHIWFGSQ